MVNGRITAEQMEWLQERADELGGNLSAAIRQTITDARLLEQAREDYKELRREHPEFEIPPYDDGDEFERDGSSRFFAVILSLKMMDGEDLELREQENGNAD
jgi:hypothetical protein